MHASNIMFRKVIADESVPADKQKETDIIEMSLPDGTVAALPATDVDQASGKRWCDLYGSKYAAFKNGDPDRDHVARLEGEIAERKAELDALHGDKRKTEPKEGNVKPPLSGQPSRPTGATPPELRVDHGMTGSVVEPASHPSSADFSGVGAKTDQQKTAPSRDFIPPPPDHSKDVI